MSNFDFNAYLANRLSTASINDKLSAIESATQQKVAQLDEKQAKFEAARKAEIEAYEASWAGQLGLDGGGFAANRINDVASLVSGASRLVGNTLALPASVASMGVMAGVTEDEVAAFNRYKAGQSQPGDLATLAAPKDEKGTTALSQIASAEEFRDKARAVNDTFDLSKIVEQTNRQGLIRDLGDGFDKSWSQVTQGWDEGKKGNFLSATAGIAKGLGGLLANAGEAIVTNPSAVREYVIENAPQLLLGAYGKAGQAAMAASNVGYAVDTYQQGIENYAKTNQGQLPDEGTRNRMAMQAVTLALAEQAGDMVGLSAANLGKKAADGAIDAATDAVKRSAFKNILKATGEGFGSEALTEGYQTWAEGEITGKPASAKEIYTGAVIGGASGAGLSGGLRTLAEITGATPEKAAEEQDRRKKADVQNEAIATGNVDALINPESKHYSPTDAIAALQKRATADDATEEIRKASIEQVAKTIQDLEARRETFQTNLDTTSVEGVKAQLAKLDDEIAQTDPDQVEQLSNMESVKQILLEELDYLAKADPKQLEKEAESYRKQLEKLDGQLAEARKASSDFNRELTSRIDADEAVKKIASGDATAAQSGADDLINLSMSLPERVGATVAQQLADDTNNALTDVQRQYFRAFSKARQLDLTGKTKDDVSEEILNGGTNAAGERFWGLNEYRREVMGSLSTGNTKRVEDLLGQLSRFGEDHKNKATAITEAFQTFKETGQPQLLISDAKRGWFYKPGTEANEEERRKAGTLNIDAKSSKLAATISSTSQTIDATLAELQAAYSLKTSTISTPNVSETTETQQGQTQGSEVPGETSATGAGTPNATVGTGTGTDVNASGGELNTGTVVPNADDATDGSSVNVSSTTSQANVPTAFTEEIPDSTATKPAQNTAGNSTATAPSAPVQLNEGQKSAYDSTVKFLKSAAKTFSIVGSAGTGKTTIVNTILQNLNKEGLGQLASKVVLASPTHRANTVLRGKNPDTKILTLHSLLGLSPQVNLAEYDSKDLKFKKRDSLEDEDSAMPQDGLLIVDESSMINDELFKVLTETAQESNTKIIFLGDMAQLQPVKQATDSKALGGTEGQAVLDQVMRAKNPELLSESVAVRETGRFTGQNTMVQGNGVAFTDNAKAFVQRAANFFSSEEFKKNPLLVRILAFRNDRVAAYNRAIRKARFGKDAAPFVEGDLLFGYGSFGLKDKQTGMTSIANGVDYLVKGVLGTRPATFFGVPVEVIDIRIQDAYEMGGINTIPVVSPNTPKETIDRIAKAAKSQKERAERNPSEWKKFFAEKSQFVIPFDVAVKRPDGRLNNLVNKTADYGYAHTVHKSQGGTYTYAMVDDWDIGAARSEKDKERLRYVGLTRAERGAFVLTQTIAAEGTPKTQGGSESASGTSVKAEVGASAGSMTEESQQTEEEIQSNDNATTTPEEPTEGAVEDSDSDEQDNTTTTENETENAGTLNAIRQQAGAAVRYVEKKLGDFLTQQAGRDGAGSKRPLVLVKNFMSQWDQKTIKLSDFLKNKEKPSDEQRSALNVFKEKFGAWSPLITRNLRSRDNPIFNHEDPIRYLIENGDLEENVKAAMVAAAVAYVGDLANSKAFNDDSSINSILGRQSDDTVLPQTRNLLAPVGMYQPVMADRLGSLVLDALGFKARSDAPKNLLPALTSSLGAHVLRLMQDPKVGLLEATAISNAQMDAMRAGENPDLVEIPEGDRYGHVFYRLVRDKDFKPTGEAKVVADALKGSQNILQNLFGMESAVKFPSLEPIKSIQKESDTGRPVLKFLKKVFKQKQQKDAWRINKDPFKIMGLLSEEQQLELIGVEEPTTENTHVSNLAGKQAKNEGLEREYTLFMDFVSDYLLETDNKLDQDFFLKYDMWKQQRVGIESTAVNPQSSKVHRWLVAPEAWTTTIKLDNAKSMLSFQLRVAEGLGIKTEKALETKSVETLNARLAQPVYKEGLAALQQALYQPSVPLTALQQQQITNAVKAGGEKLHTLAALVAYAHYQQAVDTKADSFTTNLVGEVDGVANGTMLNHVFYGAATSAAALNTFLERGGFYNFASKFKAYNVWRSQPSHLDVYESSVHALFDRVTQIGNKKPALRPVIAALWATSGTPIDDNGQVSKAGRNLVKEALNPINYGAGFPSMVRGMAGSYVDGIFARFEELSKEGAAQEKVDTFVAALNVVLAEGKEAPLPVGKTIGEYMRTPLSQKQMDALVKVYSKTVGQAATEVVEKNFKAFLDRKKLLTETTSMAYSLYEAVYNGMREEMIRELGIPRDAKGQLIHDLSADQEKELQDKLASILPLMHTAMSQDEGNLDAGILLAKRERKAINERPYQLQVSFVTPLQSRLPGVAGPKQMTVAGRVMQSASPGVVAVSGSTHSSDSRISHKTQEGRHILNIHDAILAGIGGLQDAGHAMNQNAWDTLLNYSPMEASYGALMRVMNGMVALDRQGLLSPEVRASLAPLVKAAVPMARKMFAASTAADRTKLEAMSNWEIVDQYALSGGSYKVTDGDRKAALLRLNNLPQSMSQNDAQALAQLKVSILGAKQAQDKAQQDMANALVKAVGKVGPSTVRSDPTLVEFFEENPIATLGEVLELLNEPGRLNGIDQKILSLVARTVAKANPNVTFRYVTPLTDPTTFMAPPKGPSRAWYVANKNGKAEVYILSPEFANSGLKTDTLLHELVHAAVAHAIKFPTADSAALVKELTTLMGKAKAYVEANKLTGFGDALTDVQEFVAWGMTSREFQALVLTKIQMASETRGNRLVTAMQRFVTALARFFYRAPDEQLESGLMVLISNVSGLMKQATEGEQGAADVNLSQSAYEEIERYTTEDVFNALNYGTLNNEFVEHLRGLLDGIVDKLHGPFGAMASAMRKDAASNPMAAWLKALATGQAPFAAQAVTAGFAASAQEDFVAEQVAATVKSALDRNESTTSSIYRELRKLYEEARVELQGKLPQKDYDFLFKAETGANNRSDYLARFAALGLANQQVNQQLQFATKVTQGSWLQGKTAADKLVNVFQRILSMLGAKLAHVYAGQQADTKLTSLVEQLVAIEARKRHSLQMRQGNSLASGIEAQFKSLTEAARGKVESLAGASIIQDSSLAMVRASGSVVRMVAGQRVDVFMDTLRKFRDSQTKERDGLAVSLLNEIKGPNNVAAALHRAMKHLETLRKREISQYSSMARDAFADGKNFSQEQKNSVTRVFMRTGLHSLLDALPNGTSKTLADIERLMGNEAALAAEINRLESLLPQNLRKAYVEQAHALGEFKNTDKSATPVLMMNAHVIARMLDTAYASWITEEQAKSVEPVIKQLVSLYALKYTEARDVQLAKEILRTENARTDGNGVEFTLKVHKELEKESLERIFKGNPVLMMHGYTPDILNPHNVVVSATEAEGEDLIAQGYVKLHDLPKDAADPTTEKMGLYQLKDGGLAPYLSGAISLTSMQARGTKKTNGYYNVNTEVGLENAIIHSTINHRKDKRMGRKDPHRNMRNDREVNLVPVYNDKGKIIDWRYMMTAETKDVAMQRDNSFDAILGTLAGSIFDKATATEQNTKALRALREQYRKEYGNDRDAYVEISPRSSDPAMREIWHMLPEATQKAAFDIWGRKEIFVRKDSVDVLFGYRKFSLAQMFERDPKQRKAFEKFVMNMVELLLRSRGYSPEEIPNLLKKIGWKVARGERMWQEIMRETKDIIVVRTGTVLLGNIISNFSLLFAQGVPFKEILRHHKIALDAALAYQRDQAKLKKLETLQNSGFQVGPDSLREMVQLRDAIERNPVKLLIDEGLMPSIVEDVANETDPFSFKSEWQRKTEKYTERLNPTAKAVAKNVYMTRDTWAYQALSKTTQLSDFVARYTLYQHLINRERNPLSHKDAVQKASDAFVNYDIPMHKGLQYTDDMGITMFTKYFLRIQRVLAQTAKDNPLRVLSLLLLGNYLDSLPIVLDSSLVHHLGNNPLNLGVLQYPFALDDLATVSSAMALVK